MDRNEAKGYVLSKLRETDPEQLEYLCEAVIRQTESPKYIEVTPFRQDGGIDIQGSVGGTLYQGEFGVQVKQTDRRIGAPTIQRFGGALDVDGANFGTFITTSEFTKPARTDVEETEKFSIQLISGPRLADIMVDREMGVVQQSEEDDTYAREYDFWGQFEVDDDLINSSMVPQADDLDVVHKAVLGVDSGHQIKPELAEWLTNRTGREWTRRQADYYAIAAHALGLLAVDSGKYEVRGTVREVRKWRLTPTGEKYVSLYQGSPRKAKKLLQSQVEDLEIVRLVSREIEEEIAIFQHEIADIIRKETAVSGSTADRRATTIGKWFDQIDGPIRRMDKSGSVKYAYQAGLTDEF